MRPQVRFVVAILAAAIITGALALRRHNSSEPESSPVASVLTKMDLEPVVQAAPMKVEITIGRSKWNIAERDPHIQQQQ